MCHACPEYAFFCRLLVDNFERHLIKKDGGVIGIRLPGDVAALTDFKSQWLEQQRKTRIIISIYYNLLIFLTFPRFSQLFNSEWNENGTRICYFTFLNHTFKSIQHSFNISPNITICLYYLYMFIILLQIYAAQSMFISLWMSLRMMISSATQSSIAP